MYNDYCVISSNCISGYWYRDIVKKQYEVPFIWSNIKLSNMIYLIKNFENINFENIEVVISDGEIVNGDGRKHLKVIVDNKISVYFIHYKQSKEQIETPIIDGVNVICPDVIKYAKEAWLNRCKRIPYDKKKVWVFWDDNICTDVDLSQFMSLAKEKTNEIFVLFTTKKRNIFTNKKFNNIG